MYKKISFIKYPSYALEGIRLFIGDSQYFSLGCIADGAYTIENVTNAFEIYIDFKKYNTYSKEDVLEYIKFISNGGFPIEVEDLGELILSLNRDKYKTYSQVLTVYTMIRLLFYPWQEGSAKIPETAINIYNELKGEIPEIECLQIAHYKALEYIDGTHSLMSGTKTISKLEDIKSKLIIGNGVNDSFDGKQDIDASTIIKSAKKDLKEFIKLLYEYNNI